MITTLLFINPAVILMVLVLLSSKGKSPLLSSSSSICSGVFVRRTSFRRGQCKSPESALRTRQGSLTLDEDEEKVESVDVVGENNSEGDKFEVRMREPGVLGTTYGMLEFRGALLAEEGEGKIGMGTLIVSDETEFLTRGGAKE